MTARLKMTCLGLFSLLILGSGCVATSRHFVGNTTSPAQPIIALQPGGPHADSWQTFDIKLDYQYQQDGDMFEISGVAVLSSHYEIMYARLRDLKVYLFFLDKDSRVLQAEMLDRSLTIQLDERLQFTRFYKVPPGTASITFGYDGTVRGENEGRAMMMMENTRSFYLLPLGK
jgi:hypothetical protein